MLWLVSYIFQPNFETTKSLDRRAVNNEAKLMSLSEQQILSIDVQSNNEAKMITRLYKVD